MDQKIPGDICRKHNCHCCCLETEMLLSKDDITRITRITSFDPKMFAYHGENGSYKIKNIQRNDKDHCFFLEQDGLCSIYEQKPEGCHYYPFVWDLSEHTARIDSSFCPHYLEFEQQFTIPEDLEVFILKLFGKL